LTPEILTLLEIMRKFNVWGLAMLLHHIDHAIEAVKPMAAHSELRDERLTPENVKMWLTGNIMMADHTRPGRTF
jgi:hypothetical protein